MARLVSVLTVDLVFTRLPTVGTGRRLLALPRAWASPPALVLALALERCLALSFAGSLAVSLVSFSAFFLALRSSFAF